MEIMSIDCGTCAVRGLACGDCVVTALLGAADDNLSFDGAEQEAVAMLSASGLVPPLRLVPSPTDPAVRPARRLTGEGPAAATG